MNAQPRKNIPIQFLKFVVDGDNMIIPITYRDKKEQPASWPLGNIKLFQKQTDKPNR
jgi:purine nucleoside permease